MFNSIFIYIELNAMFIRLLKLQTLWIFWIPGPGYSKLFTSICLFVYIVFLNSSWWVWWRGLNVAFIFYYSTLQNTSLSTLKITLIFFCSIFKCCIFLDFSLLTLTCCMKTIWPICFDSYVKKSINVSGYLFSCIQCVYVSLVFCDPVDFHWN